MNADIKVSVCVVTYNQEKYIAQCLQTLVDQKTSFKFEVVVSDDCSTDRTREIIIEFASKYPDIIKPLLHNKNMGAYENFLFVHKQAVGKYIAHMDGDDYSLPGKIQCQADFLDSNSNCNIVWHPVSIEMQSGVINNFKNKSLLGKRFYRKDIIKLIAIGANSSKMYRKSVRDFELPGFEIVDYYANVEQVKDGYAAFCSDKPLGIYRAGIGIASSGPKTRIILTKCFSYFSKKYPEYRLHANTAAFTYFIVDFKNLRPTAWLFFKSFLMTFHPLFIIEFVKVIKFIRSN